MRRKQAEGRARCSAVAGAFAAEPGRYGWMGTWAGRGAGGSPGLGRAFNADGVSQGTAESSQSFSSVPPALPGRVGTGGLG